jgi:hypothetical protein
MRALRGRAVFVYDERVDIDSTRRRKVKAALPMARHRPISVSLPRRASTALGAWFDVRDHA